MRLKMFLFRAAMALLLLAAPAAAQFETSELLGTVRDPSGAVMAGVTVTLINQETGVQANTVTDASGNYSFFNVRVGRYTVTAEAPGFARFSTSDVMVNVNSRQRVDITMQVGAVTEVVEVKEAAAVLQTDTSEKSQVVRTEQIVELPLNGRNALQLVALAPNVSFGFPAAGQAQSRQGGIRADQSIAVAGQRAQFNRFSLDGVENTDPNFNTIIQ